MIDSNEAEISELVEDSDWAERRDVIQGAISEVLKLDPLLVSFQRQLELTILFRAIFSVNPLKAGDETAVLDVIIEHFGLSKSHRFEISKLWNSTREAYLTKPEKIEVVDVARAEQRKQENKLKFQLPKALIENVPGLVGEIASWITDTAPKPQQVLSLGAALACVGVLKAHRVKSPTGLRTNHFIIGLADSGSGKEHPRKMIDLLMRSVSQEGLISGIPASGSSIRTLLASRRGKALIQWDEFGQALEQLSAINAPPHLKNIIEEMLSIWGMAGSFLPGKERTDPRLPKSDVDQPCLCFFGTTNPHDFFNSLSSKFVANGFLPRFLILAISNPDVEWRELPDVEDPPVELVERIAKLNYLPTNVRDRGNLDKINRIRPAVIPFAPFAKDRVQEGRAYFDEKRKKFRATGKDAIWNRALEHTIKIALTVSDGEVIGKKEFDWSLDLVDKLLEHSCSAYDLHIAETPFQRLTNKALSLIVESPGISRSKLLRKLKISTYDLERVCDYLRESELAVCQSEKTAGRSPEKWYSK